MTAVLRNRFALAALLGTAVFCGYDLADARAQDAVEDRDAISHTIAVPTSDRTKLQLNVYPQNLAVIAEQRDVAIPAGKSTLRIGGIPQTLIDDSVLIGTSRESNLVWTSLRKQSNNYGAIEGLLRSAIGEDVVLRRTDDTLVSAKLLAVTHIALVQTSAGIEQVPLDQIILDDLPDGFSAEPTLDADIATSDPLDHISMAYLLGGYSWNTSYIGHYDSTKNSLQLSAVARVINQSGGDIENAQLRLFAGDPNRVTNAPVAKAARGEMMMSAMADSAGSAPAREGFENLHIYGPFDGLSMRNGDTVILPLLDTRNLDATRQAIFTSSSSTYNMGANSQPEFVRPNLEITVTNDGGEDEKSPWPDGVLRVFANDAKGATTFLSEDSIPLTPVGRDATIQLGKASNLSGTRTVTSFVRTARASLPDAIEASMEWEIKNTSSREETVLVRENVPDDWEIGDESHPHSRPQPGLIVWKIKVPANQEVTLRWSVESPR
ncbi:DUF4139 domain-containing protein [Thalassospira sp. MA62]|nr:DUF4139 domain-containing protein [Thalassospira sp. MA62]